MYSALKHKGERLYKLARQGVEVEREARQVTIFEMELLEFRLPLVTFRVPTSCSISRALSVNAAPW